MVKSNSERQEKPNFTFTSASNDLLSPAYQVMLGSDRFDAESDPCLISVRVTRSMGLPTDSCELLLIESKDYKFKKGDEIKVELGYSGKLSPVFSGLVNNIEHGLFSVRVVAVGLVIGLLRLRLNRVYLSQTAGKIVSNLVQEVHLKVKTVSDGITLPTYVVDDTTNVFEHILKLAERCNFNTYINEDNQFVFEESSNGESIPLYFSKEIIRVETMDLSPLYSSTRIFGESPSSIKGSETSHWLTKQEVKGESGKGFIMSVEDPVIRDNKTAEIVAKSRMSKLDCTIEVRVEVVGKPEIKLGDSVTLEDVPNFKLKGSFEVKGFEHYLSKSKGFTTKISCWLKGGTS
jgi:phage protein D